MATATSKLTVNAFPSGVDNTQKQYVIYGTCALSSGGTYITNGIPLNWMTLFNPDGSVFQPQVSASQTTPIVAYFVSAIGGVETATPALQSYIYDGVHNTLRIYEGSAEVGSGSAIVADTISFEAHFARFN
jgi:hypothetical protein